MLGTVAWAIMNAFIIGAVWIGIALSRKVRRLTEEQERLEDDVARRQDQLAEVNARVALLEERLDFSERRLGAERQPAPLPNADPPRN
jgi:hypothetical protein